MERRQRVLVYALLAGCAASLTAYRFTGVGTPGASSPTAPAMATIVVAKREIPAGFLLTADQVEVRKVPQGAKAEGALSGLAEMDGRYSRDRLLAGEQVVAGRLLDRGQAFSLPVTIPIGKRALTVACNEVTGVAGFVKPGDYVDVLGTFDAETMGQPVTLTVLQGLQVLAISQEMKKVESEAAKLYTSATLAVTLEQAQKLTLAEEKGRLRLLLRPPGVEPSEVRDVTTPAQLVPANGGKQLRTVISPDAAAAPRVAARPRALARRVVTVTSVSSAQAKEVSAFSVEIIRGVARETVLVSKL